MQRKAGFPRLATVKELQSTKTQACAKLEDKKETVVNFQNLVSTITMTKALCNRRQMRKLNTSEDSGEFYVSHATSPDDDDRRPDTTMTDPSTIRSDVLSRLNMSDHFRFTTRPNRKFQEMKVCKAIKQVLEERLQDCTYNAKFCQEISPVLADAIKERIKRLLFPRYKIICHVLMGQVTGQSMRSVSRCAWNEEFDNFAQYCYQTPTLYAIGVVYGVYTE